MAGVAAVAAAAGLSIFLVERAHARGLVGLIAALALVSLSAGLGWRRASSVAWSIALLGLAYGLTLIGAGGTVDAWSLLAAGWLFLYAESAYLALETGPQSFWPWRHVLTAPG